jgi:ubiquitin-conjugating enzyme E2 R
VGNPTRDLLPATNPLIDFKFERPLFHPNVYPDGKLCISILHPPGDDEMAGESAAIRWSPAQRVESVLLSVLSLLDDANIDSPANVDASKMYRDDPEGYKKMVQADLDASKKDIPLGFVMPTAEAFNTKKSEPADFDDTWADSEDEEFDFSGSDSDMDIEDMGSEEEDT